MSFKSLSAVLFSAFVLFSCKNINVEIVPEDEDPYLLGQIDRKGLEGPNYIEWFQENYDFYEPDTETVDQLKSQLGDYDLLVFLGTWCEDSQFQIPGFYKILDAIDYPEDQLTVVALSEQDDLYKQSPQHEEAGLNIEFVPTIIVYKDDVELGRIEEFPMESLEKDLLNIISSGSN
jgi:thiol-disulfide isomerase/thioredoxin